jgi:membrane protease YdiL (CAAX protease family)
LEKVAENRTAAPEEPLETGQSSGNGPWLGLVEALAVLVACVGTIVIIGGIVAIVLAPRVYSIEFELVEREMDGMTPATNETLVLRVADLGLPGEVETSEKRGQPLLLLTNLESVDAVEVLVNEVLIESGYRPSPGKMRTGFDGMAMITNRPEVTIGLQAAVLILFGGVFYRFRVSPPITTEVARIPVAVLAGLAAGGAGFVCSIVIAYVQQLLGWTIEEQAWLMELLKNRDSLWTLIPWIVVVVPFAEETFFRGYFFRFLHQRSGIIPAYLLSAGCFSLIHFHLPGLLVYFVVGIFFSYVCRRTSTLLAPVVGHITYNGLALAVALMTLA